MTTDDRDGATRIADERRRVLAHEGFDLENDRGYTRGQLLWAARAYINEADGGDGIFTWPFPADPYWKPSEDPVRNLEKAGQFIAAEIDRLLAMRKEAESDY